jgi:serine/threonine-protein kinase
MSPALGLRFWLRLLGLGAALCLFTAFVVMNLALKGGEVTLPDLRGKAFSAAASELRQAGITLKMDDERYSNSQLKGCVLQQDIPGGTRIKRGRTVYVVVSKGSATVTIPDLAGLSRRQAEILLQQNGLNLDSATLIPGAAPAEAVLAQFPEAGSSRAQGTGVQLLVSQGPQAQRWVMPSLAGRALETAQAAASAMGLVLKDVAQEDRPGAEPGSVLTQSLQAGSPVAAGDELSLVVARGRADISKARLATLRYQVPDDARSERRVRIAVTDAAGSRVVHNEMEKPGALVTVAARVYGMARYRVQLAGAEAYEGEIP